MMLCQRVVELLSQEKICFWFRLDHLCLVVLFYCQKPVGIKKCELQSLAANFARKCNNIKVLKGWFSAASLSFGKGTLPLLSHGQDVKCYFEREKCQNALKAQNLG